MITKNIHPTYMETLTEVSKDFVATMVKRAGQYRTYRQTVRELQALNSRELEDLGISRSAIKAIALDCAYH